MKRSRGVTVVRGAGAAIGVKAAHELSRLGGAVIAPGLTKAEFARIETQFGFEFADDHRAFLAVGLPIGPRWPDWRNGAPEELRSSLDWPVRGLLFDVGHGSFWPADWGDRPVDTNDALAVARDRLSRVPQMVPVYAHRYLPAGRGTYGHPVLSTYQDDVICFGEDLLDYVYQEFGRQTAPTSSDPNWQPRPTVEFWSELVR